MSEIKATILESWPDLKDDLEQLLKDTDCWIIDKLEKAHARKDWGEVSKIIEIMKMIHNLSHTH